MQQIECIQTHQTKPTNLPIDDSPRPPQQQHKFPKDFDQQDISQIETHPLHACTQPVWISPISYSVTHMIGPCVPNSAYTLYRLVHGKVQKIRRAGVRLVSRGGSLARAARNLISCLGFRTRWQVSEYCSDATCNCAVGGCILICRKQNRYIGILPDAFLFAPHWVFEEVEFWRTDDRRYDTTRDSNFG